ncbi:TIR domain-containing protein [Lentzea sp. NPDC051213]|uniref:TIR domain-containing protein n=1 Tax=Lentzea sp. NPDC051213 TaxID=3364126 RepID=UPI00379C14DC
MPPDRLIVSYTDVDRRWAKWIAFQLEQAGVAVHVDYEPGSNVVVELDLMVARGDRMIAVVSEEALRDPRCRGHWAAVLNLDSTGSARRLIPVLVGPCTPDALLGALSPVRLDGLGREEAAAALLTALGLGQAEPAPPAFPGYAGEAARRTQRIEALLSSPPAAVTRQRLDVSDGPLPRLRFLSDQARTDIGQVAGVSFEAGLYVRRDVESGLLAHLRTPGAQPLLVVGEPGVGKSSLLWGVASALLQDGDREVLLLAAPWLRELALDGQPMVRRDVVAQAIRAAAAQGRASTVLVDTADLVVNDLPALLELAGVVDVAEAAGASVLVTTRPSEARFLPAWDVITLGHYGMTAEPGEASEFERAVASHCLVYNTTARSAHEMAAKLVSLVLREGPGAHLCSRPLTMRMLFELYAPASLPDHVDVTALYQRFWRDRVERDRRAWGSRSTSDTDADLTPVVLRLAEHMLAAGIPEAPLRAVGTTADAGSITVEDGVAELVRRGVGEVTPVAGERVFRFFHQTFFEFAAAQAWWRRRGPAALVELGDRARSTPDDYFLLAVYEQTWLCAWRDDTAFARVSEVAENLLDEFRRGLGPLGWTTGEQFPYSLRRSVLSVFALAAKLSPSCHKKFGDVLRDVELPLLRDCLRLMPVPSRHWTESDITTLVPCAGREDKAWIAVLGVLGRLAQRDPRLAVPAVRRLDLVERVTSLAGRGLNLHTELAELLVRAAHEPDALGLLRRMCGDPAEAEWTTNVFRVIAAKAETSSEIDFAAWADEVAGDVSWKSPAGMRAHAELHRRQVCLAAGDEGDWAGQLDELKALVGLLNGRQRLVSRDRPRLAGLLLAFGHDAPLDTAEAVAAVLRTADSRALHAELRQGWLVGFAVRCPNAMTQNWIAWLVEGLPAARYPEAGANQLWANTIRRTLELQAVPLTAVATITDAAASQLTSGSWRDENSLRRLVMRAFAGGSASARRVLELALEDPADEGDDLVGSVPIAVGPLADLDLLFDLLLRWRRLGHLAELVDRQEVPAELIKAKAPAILDLVAAHRERGSTRQQQAAVVLFDAAFRRGAVDLPEWTDLKAWLEETVMPHARNVLVGLIGDGLRQHRYPHEEARPVLTALLGSDRFARRELVELISVWGGEQDAEELLRLAFTKPIDHTRLATASNFVRRDRRGSPPLPFPVAVRFVADFATGLKGVSDQARRNTAIRWRSAMTGLLSGTGLQEQLDLLGLLPRLEEHFAANVVLQLEPWRYPEVRSRLNEMVDWAHLGGQLRRNIRLVLANTRRPRH